MACLAISSPATPLPQDVGRFDFQLDLSTPQTLSAIPSPRQRFSSPTHAFQTIHSIETIQVANFLPPKPPSPQDVLTHRFGLSTCEKITAFVHDKTQFKLKSDGIDVLPSFSEAFSDFQRPSDSNHEKLMFHGTTHEICHKIAEYGMLPSLDGILGPGCYFAPSPELALQYSRYKESNSMLMCLVNAEGAKSKGYDQSIQFCVEPDKCVPLAVLVFEEP